VVEEAGLSAGCVYTHFRSKREIVDAIATDRHVCEEQAITAANVEREPLAALRSVADGFFTDLSTRRGIEERRLAVQTWAEALLDPDVLRLVRTGVEKPVAALAEIVRRAQKEGALAPALDADALARAMVALFHGFVLQKLWNPRVATGPYTAVLDALLGALATPCPTAPASPPRGDLGR